MFSEGVETLQTTESLVIDPDFVRNLAQNALGDLDIRAQLMKQGYKQIELPYLGYVRDTMRPNMSREETALWSQKQNDVRSRYIETLSAERKRKIEKERNDYEKTLSYMEEQVRQSLQILLHSKYGLREVFMRRINGGQIGPKDISQTMRAHGVEVTEFPEKMVGFDGRENHGESRFTKGGWRVKFNGVALGNTDETLHELIAIESFDNYLGRKPKLGEVIEFVPMKVVGLLAGASLKESNARALHNLHGGMSIMLLESYYDHINAFKGKSEYIDGFVKLFTDNKAK